jgi:hypothetical protein
MSTQGNDPAVSDLFKTPAKKAEKGAAPETSPDKERLDKKIAEMGMIGGLAFLTVLNNHGLYVIPSRKNFAGVVQFRDAVADSGCGGFLLKLEDESSIDALFSEYGDANGPFVIKLGDSTGATGVGRTLVIKHVSENGKFSLTLGADLFGTAAAVQVPGLRFQLHSSAAKYIVDTPQYFDAFKKSDREDLLSLQDAGIPQITVSLIGNLITENFSEVRQNRVRYFFDAEKTPSVNLKQLSYLSDDIMHELKATLKLFDGIVFDLHEFRINADLTYDY